MELQYYNQFIGFMFLYIIGGLVSIHFICNLTKKSYRPDTVMTAALMSWIFVTACIFTMAYFALKQLRQDYDTIKRKYGRNDTGKSIGSDDKRKES